MQHDKIHAPMACTIVEVCVSPGQLIVAGETLLILEATKMEHEVRAESAARVAELLVG